MPDEKTGPYQITPSSNNNALRIALIIFGVLLIILLAEGGYYLYNNYLALPQKTQETGPDPNKPLVVDDEPILVETPTPSPEEAGKTVNFAIAEEVISKLRSLTNFESLVSDANMQITLTGVVQEAYFREQGDSAYTIHLTTSGGGSVYYSLTDEELLELDVYILENGERKSSSISEVKVGQFINIISNFDLMEESAFYKTGIEIIR